MHIIHTGWLKQYHTSIIAFDIAQFFPFLNHSFLAKCLGKASLNPNIINFFDSYHTNRTAIYIWNSFSLPSFNTNVGVGQGSALSPIISTMYMAPIIKMFKKRIKNLEEKIPSDTLSFIDDGFLFHKRRVMNCPLLFFFVATISYQKSSSIQVWSWNTPNWKYSTSRDLNTLQTIL